MGIFFLKKCDGNSWSIILVVGNQSCQVDMRVGGRAPARHGNISEDSGG